MDYATEIDAIYNAVQDSTQVDIPVPTGSSEAGGWTLEESLGFLRNLVTRIMTNSKDMGDDDDLFSLGCDRLVYQENTFRSSTYLIILTVYRLRTFVTPCSTDYDRFPLPQTFKGYLPMLCTRNLRFAAWRRMWPKYLTRRLLLSRSRSMLREANESIRW